MQARRLVERLRAECPPLARIDAVEMRPAFARDLGQDFGDEFRIALSQRGACAPRSRPTPRHARSASPRFAILSRAASAMLSPIAPIAARASRSFGKRLMTARAPPWRHSSCAMIAAPNMKIPPTGASTPRRSPATPAARARGWSGRGAAPVEFSAFSMLDDVDAVAGLMLKGHIVAIKGLGGYHLACDATNAGRGPAPARAQEALYKALRADGARSRCHAPLCLRLAGGRVCAKERGGADHAPLRRAPMRACPKPSRRGFRRSASCCPRRPCIISFSAASTGRW